MRAMDPFLRRRNTGAPDNLQGNIGIIEKRMETAIVYRGNIGIIEKRMETAIVYRGNIGIIEKRMETAIVYRGNIGIIEKRMETSIVCQYAGSIRWGSHQRSSISSWVEGLGFLGLEAAEYWSADDCRRLRIIVSL